MHDPALVLLAPVKVNLTLHVGRIRRDGYHPIHSLCAFPKIGDLVALEGRWDDFVLSVDGPFAGDLVGVPDESNLVLRAARLIADQAGAAPYAIRLTKRVPAASGIGGGTADAAATLVLLNREAPRPLGDAALIALSRRLGADGPVCTAARLAGGGVWEASGDGDQVCRLPGAPPGWMTLSNPRRAVPTGDVFGRFDAGEPAVLRSAEHPTPRAASFFGVVREGRNDLRTAALAIEPRIAAIERDLAAAPGCLLARMSGSGATVFGLFSSAIAARRAATAERGRGRWAAAGALLR